MNKETLKIISRHLEKQGDLLHQRWFELEAQKTKDKVDYWKMGELVTQKMLISKIVIALNKDELPILCELSHDK